MAFAQGELEYIDKEGIAYELTNSFKRITELTAGRSFDFTSFSDDAIEFIPYNDDGTVLEEDKKDSLFEYNKSKLNEYFINYASPRFSVDGLTEKQKENYRKVLFYIKEVFLNPNRTENVPRLEFIKPDIEKYNINYSMPLINYLARIGDNREAGIDRDVELASLAEKAIRNKHLDILNSLLAIETAHRHWYHRLILFNGGPVVGAKTYETYETIQDEWLTKVEEGNGYSLDVPLSNFNLEGEYHADFTDTFFKFYGLFNFVFPLMGPHELKTNIENVTEGRFPDMSKVEGIQGGFLLRLKEEHIVLNSFERNVLAYYLDLYEDNVEVEVDSPYITNRVGTSNRRRIPLVTSRDKLKKLQRECEEEGKYLDYVFVIDLVTNLSPEENSGDRNEYLDKYIKGFYIYVNKNEFDPQGNHLIPKNPEAEHPYEKYNLLVKDISLKDTISSSLSANGELLLYSWYDGNNTIPSTLEEVSEDNSKNITFYPLYSVQNGGHLKRTRDGLFKYYDLDPHYLLDSKHKNENGSYAMDCWLPIGLELDSPEKKATIWTKFYCTFDKTEGTTAFEYSVFFPKKDGWEEDCFIVTDNTTGLDTLTVKEVFRRNKLFKEFVDKDLADKCPHEITKLLIKSMEIFPAFVKSSYYEYLGGVPSSSGGNGGTSVSSIPTYDIKEVSQDYTTVADDFTGNRVLRVTVNAPNGVMTLTRPPSEEFKGKSLIVTVDGGFLSIQNSGNVNISPSDATYLRRPGAAVTLVYKGNGEYLAFGELP